jgi:CheY-like chemotaxis protein/nitrogen-specific signal transduction histidine kinase
MHEANKANEHKGEFLARMSHEIRTPMNAIIGLANIVQRNLGDHNAPKEEAVDIDEVKEHVRQIETSSQHLLNLLNDILDISKIEAGKIALSPEIVDLRQLVDTVVSIIKPRCDDKDVVFDVALEEFTPDTFAADSLRLRQVLINLLGNAVKFTPAKGRIEFSISRANQREGRSLVEFAIRDTGIGISPEEMAGIFQPFEQASGKITKKYGGTGLGLTISRHIVQLFGGDITVRSDAGQGSEFSFAIWLDETAESVAEEVAAADSSGKLDGRRVLLVDDVDLNRKVAKAMLKRTGITIDEAEDGLVAVRRFEESPENTYDAILMDVQMPHMNGYEASRAIRALDRADAQRVPIIALTANAFKEDIDKALLAGMNDHIAKPVKMEQLVEVLFKFLGGAEE